MQSVFAQQFDSYEYLVIDGGSTDGGKEFIEQHADKLSYYVSEKDRGIYNAMNKGILKAVGEYLLFLNSGDFLESAESLGAYRCGEFSEDILCADIRVIAEGGNWVKSVPEPLSFEYFTRDTLPHQSALIKRELFDRVGMYNESLRFVSDWKFYLDALCKFNASLRRIPVVTCNYMFDGVSSKPENFAAVIAERDAILEEEYTLFYNDYRHLHQCKAALRNYENSRAHKMLNSLMRLPLYKMFKKK